MIEEKEDEVVHPAIAVMTDVLQPHPPRTCAHSLHSFTQADFGYSGGGELGR